MAPDFLHRRQADRDDTTRPVLITAARESYQDELAARKKRYFLLMSIRIPALLLAAGSLALWNNPWIALAIVAISIPVPWIAVIGANDRPPLSKEQARSYAPSRMVIPPGRELPPSLRGQARHSEHPDNPGDPGDPRSDAADDTGRDEGAAGSAARDPRDDGRAP